MPSKRKANDAEANPASNAPKRQRVSRACDQCRNAREKCDGIQPQCFSCVSLDRECTYNEAPKKRGVQTGLIRTLESALYWLFERHPGTETALNELLSNESGREALSIGKRSDAGNRLHQRWRKSRTHKEIGRLLAGKDSVVSPPNDPSDEDESGTEPDANLAAQASSTKPPTYRLPTDVSRLIDIYFTYTHPWLPIADKTRLLALASTQTQEIRDPELWAVLTVASAQDATNRTNPRDLYRTARSLLPLIGDHCTVGEEYADVASDPSISAERRELHQVNAFLLLSLVGIGRDDATTSSLLVGLAVRMLLSLGDGDSQSDADSQKTRTIMGCFLLDSLVSLRLDQVPHLTDTAISGMSMLSEDGPEEWETWSGLPGFASIDARDIMRPTQSFSSFNQLCRFARVINRRYTPQTPQPGTADLAASLDSRFSFCNSILESAAPALPTALLLQATFLGATIALSPNGRVSLLWTFMEAVEHSWQQLGPGVSPLLVTYMSIANRRAKSLGGEDKDRWDSLLAKLKATWQMQPPAPSGLQQQQTPADDFITKPSQQQMQTPLEQFDAYQQPPNSRYLGPATTASPSTARSIPFTPGNTNHIQGLHGGNGIMSPILQMHPLLSLHGGHPELMIDHDTILDELASFDCADNMDADPQFMANLGFAPGSDFTDMRGEFGPL